MNDEPDRFARLVFDEDAVRYGGYLYSTNAPLSSRLAHARISDETFRAVDFRGKRVLDVGCGDGTYTIELFDRGLPDCMYALDIAQEALKVARGKTAERRISYGISSAYALPFPSDSLDIVHLRAVLHHMDRPREALREALRVAPAIIVSEPNGLNPGLKLFERLSPYHRQHGEKSYTPHTLDRWLKEVGGVISDRRRVGFVPVFCPDWVARVMKQIEPGVERIPFISTFASAIYLVVAARRVG